MINTSLSWSLIQNFPALVGRFLVKNLDNLGVYLVQKTVSFFLREGEGWHPHSRLRSHWPASWISSFGTVSKNFTPWGSNLDALTQIQLFEAQPKTKECSLFPNGGINFSLWTLFWKHHEGPTWMHLPRFRFQDITMGLKEFPWLTPLDFLPFWSIYGVVKISLQITLLHLWSGKNMMKCNLSWVVKVESSVLLNSLVLRLMPGPVLNIVRRKCKTCAEWPKTGESWSILLHCSTVPWRAILRFCVTGLRCQIDK